MKVISITSSPRKNGNTERLVSLMEEELHSIAKLQNEILGIERISLGDMGLKLCIGCRTCFDKGENVCPLKDDLQSVRDKLMEADGLILASPVYVEDVNGIMKNWIDRMAFYCHRPAFAGKTAVVVTTSGLRSTNHTLNTMKTALTTWGFFVGTEQKFVTGDIMKTEVMYEKYRQKISEISKFLFMAVKNQQALKPKLYSLIVFKVQQKYWQTNHDAQHTMDYLYWKNKGWLEPKCVYYTLIKTNWLKLKFARFFGSFIATFFI